MKIDQKSLNQLFLDARSHKKFTDQAVSDDLLASIYEVAKYAPSASNTCPMRIVFVRTAEGKEKVIQATFPGNVDKVKSAPVTAIMAYDMAFYEQLPELAPQMPQPYKFATMPAEKLEFMVLRNASLQAGLFIAAVRAHGLDCGPMSGFNNAKIDEAFFAGSTWKSNFLMNLGYGSGEGLHPRASRLAFDVACQLA